MTRSTIYAIGIAIGLVPALMCGGCFTLAALLSLGQPTSPQPAKIDSNSYVPATEAEQAQRRKLIFDTKAVHQIERRNVDVTTTWSLLSWDDKEALAKVTWAYVFAVPDLRTAQQAEMTHKLIYFRDHRTHAYEASYAPAYGLKRDTSGPFLR